MTPRTHRAPMIFGALTLMLGISLSACGTTENGDNVVAKESASTPTASESTDATQDPTEDPTQDPAETEAPTGPSCDEIWVAGNVLPNNYNGCQDEEKGKFVQAMIYRCSSGQKLVTFRRNFYAAKGEVVNETATALARDPGFKKVLASCGA